MVTEKLVEDVREKIKAGLGEGVIKSALMSEGWPLADIEEVIGMEMKGESVAVEKPKGMGHKVKPAVFTVLGIGFALGMGLGGIKLALYLRDGSQAVDSSVGVESPISDEPTPTTESQTPTPSVRGLSEIQSKQASLLVVSQDLVSDTAYIDSIEGYKIRPPRDWTTDSSGKLGAPVFFFGPEASAGASLIYRANMNVMVGEARGHGLGNYVDLYIKNIEGSLKNFKILDERLITITGREGYFAKVAFEKEGLSLTGRLLVILNNDKAYVVTGLSMVNAWNSVGQAVETSMYTFNFL